MAFRQRVEIIEKHSGDTDKERVVINNRGSKEPSIRYIAPQALDSDAISKIIKQGTGLDEDAYQDAWLKVVEENISDPLEILNLAKQCRKQNTNQRIRAENETVSLEAPLSNNANSNDLFSIPFTRNDVIAAPEPTPEAQVDHEIDAKTQYVATGTGKINYAGNVHLDEDVREAIRRLYPHDTLNAAIAKMAGCKLKRNNQPWHKWEEQILMERYPWGGSLAVQMDVHRTRDAIEERARTLGVTSSGKAHKPVPTWLTIQEVAAICGVSWRSISKWQESKAIDAIRIKGYSHGKDGVFFQPSELERFIKHNSHLFDITKLDANYRSLITDTREYATVSEASKLMG